MNRKCSFVLLLYIVLKYLVKVQCLQCTPVTLSVDGEAVHLVGVGLPRSLFSRSSVVNIVS